MQIVIKPASVITTTLYLSFSLLLYQCNVKSSCNTTLALQMRAHDAAMARLCQLVSKQTFEQKYGLLLPQDGATELDYKQILTAHACKYIYLYHRVSLLKSI